MDNLLKDGKKGAFKRHKNEGCGTQSIVKVVEITNQDHGGMAECKVNHSISDVLQEREQNYTFKRNSQTKCMLYDMLLDRQLGKLMEYARKGVFRKQKKGAVLLNGTNRQRVQRRSVQIVKTTLLKTSVGQNYCQLDLLKLRTCWRPTSLLICDRTSRAPGSPISKCST